MMIFYFLMGMITEAVLNYMIEFNKNFKNKK